ncbi:hypothetical protein CBM2617_B120009 [Cupriavidus taiwanensis]|nr:hypothetical protein CBM2617_B120009 [Cupriavidus taiwanensis]
MYCAEIVANSVLQPKQFCQTALQSPIMTNINKGNSVIRVHGKPMLLTIRKIRFPLTLRIF